MVGRLSNAKAQEIDDDHGHGGLQEIQGGNEIENVNGDDSETKKLIYLFLDDGANVNGLDEIQYL